ncbi:MAG TPA: toxin-antitoxin system YwqK family antitoxin [Bacteroidia bacterium]|jgi:antitoxin component YwqK of YwqJK toxin-antitoxin module|nr:toxin-antitoxin system YwqK family antitoxin [Bacteroidia bacterium]
MKPFLIILISLTSILNALGQSGVADSNGFTNKAEAKNLTAHGKKAGKWVEYLDEFAERAVSNAHAKKAPYYRLTIYSDGLPYGLVRTYNMGGKLKIIIPYVNGKINGIEKWYYEDGGLEWELPFTDSVLNGVEKLYYPNGNLSQIDTMSSGKPIGIEKSYYPDGQLKGYEPFNNGMANGIKKTYYESGKLSYEYIYKNDTILSTKHYDENGNEIKQ